MDGTMELAGMDWGDGENEVEGRAVVVGGMGIPMKEGISGDGTSSRGTRQSGWRRWGGLDGWMGQG